MGRLWIVGKESSAHSALLSRSTERLALAFQNLAWCHLGKVPLNIDFRESIKVEDLLSKRFIEKGQLIDGINAETLANTSHSNDISFSFCGQTPIRTAHNASTVSTVHSPDELTIQSTDTIPNHFSGGTFRSSGVWAHFPTRVSVTFYFGRWNKDKSLRDS